MMHVPAGMGRLHLFSSLCQTPDGNNVDNKLSGGQRIDKTILAMLVSRDDLRSM